jgi:hypothetical protein
MIADVVAAEEWRDENAPHIAALGKNQRRKK